jgi:hypothetical protein
MPTTSPTGIEVSASVPGAHCVISPAVTGPFGACESGLLTDSDSSGSSGHLFLAFRARKPATGLHPSKTSFYVQRFNSTTGALEATYTFGGILAKEGGELLYASGNTVTLKVKDVGAFVPVFAYNLDLASHRMTGPLKLGSEVADDGYWAEGQFLIVGNSTPCRSTLYDLAHLRTIAHMHRCGDQVGNLDDESQISGSDSVKVTPRLLDGYFQFLQDTGRTDIAYSYTSGAEAPVRVLTSGPRSALSVAISRKTGLQTYRIGSWRTGVAISPKRTRALHLRLAGVADDDLWVRTTDQSLILDGRTGKIILHGWRYKPELGGPGWTIVNSGESLGGLSSSVLVEHPGLTLVAALPDISSE